MMEHGRRTGLPAGAKALEQGMAVPRSQPLAPRGRPPERDSGRHQRTLRTPIRERFSRLIFFGVQYSARGFRRFGALLAANFTSQWGLETAGEPTVARTAIPRRIPR